MAFFRICSVCGINDMPSSTQSILCSKRNASEDGIYEKFAKNVSAFLSLQKFPPEYFEKRPDKTGGILAQHVCKGCRTKLEAHLEAYGLWKELERSLKEKTEEILNVMRGMDDQKIATLNAYQTMVKNIERGEGKPMDFKGFERDLFEKLKGTPSKPDVNEESWSVARRTLPAPGTAPARRYPPASIVLPLPPRVPRPVFRDPAASGSGSLVPFVTPVSSPVFSPIQLEIKQELSSDSSSGSEEVSGGGGGSGQRRKKRKTLLANAGKMLLDLQAQMQDARKGLTPSSGGKGSQQT